MDNSLVKAHPNQDWECVDCGWIGKHSDSADKTIVKDGMWGLICPTCGSDEFYKSAVPGDSEDNIHGINRDNQTF